MRQTLITFFGKHIEAHNIKLRCVCCHHGEKNRESNCVVASNPISYWADMSKHKDKAENLTGCSLMEQGRKMAGDRVAQKGSGTNS